MRAFVLGGGGARGALQVGALRAILEAGIQPDLLVGTSIGAANAAFLAIRGTAVDALADLEDAWRVAAGADLLPANYLWLTVRSLFNRPGFDGGKRIRDYFVGQGLEPDLRFGDLDGPPLILVAADLKGSCAVLHGLDPEERILDGVLASTAIPPWVRPVTREGRRLMDGGAVSNLPIEPALSQGATEIVALDLADARPVMPDVRGFGSFLYGLIHTVEQRQVFLELRLAEARRVPVHHIKLVPDQPVAVWEFASSLELFEPGYRLTRQYLVDHPELGTKNRRSIWARLVRRKV